MVVPYIKASKELYGLLSEAQRVAHRQSRPEGYFSLRPERPDLSTQASLVNNILPGDVDLQQIHNFDSAPSTSYPFSFAISNDTSASPSSLIVSRNTPLNNARVIIGIIW